MASKSKKRRRVLGASCILAALIIAGSSFAWFTSKDEVTNRLSASSDYGVKIVESFAPPKNWIPGQEVNKDTFSTNTGSVAAFVRNDVSGVLTLTKEEAVTTGVTWAIDKNENEGTVTLTEAASTGTNGVNFNDFVELTTDEKYLSVEAGSYLAYKPAKSAIDLGRQIVKYPSGSDAAYVYRDTVNNKSYTLSQADFVAAYGATGAEDRTPTEVTKLPTGVSATTKANEWKKVEAKDDFTPDVEGMYVFRRTIDVDMYGMEDFTYAAYYFKDGKYYKITDLEVTQDDTDLADQNNHAVDATKPDTTYLDRAGDGNEKDGQLSYAKGNFVKEVTTVYEQPREYKYDAKNNRLVANYLSTDDSNNSYETEAKNLDTAEHNLAKARTALDRAIRDNESANTQSDRHLNTAGQLTNELLAVQARLDKIGDASTDDTLLKDLADKKKNLDTTETTFSDSFTNSGKIKNDEKRTENAWNALYGTDSNKYVTNSSVQYMTATADGTNYDNVTSTDYGKYIAPTAADNDANSLLAKLKAAEAAVEDARTTTYEYSKFEAYVNELINKYGPTGTITANKLSAADTYDDVLRKLNYNELVVAGLDFITGSDNHAINELTWKYVKAKADFEEGERTLNSAIASYRNSVIQLGKSGTVEDASSDTKETIGGKEITYTSKKVTGATAGVLGSIDDLTAEKGTLTAKKTALENAINDEMAAANNSLTVPNQPNSNTAAQTLAAALTAYQTASEEYDKKLNEYNAKKKAYENNKELKIYINLSDDVVTYGGVANKWQLLNTDLDDLYSRNPKGVTEYKSDTPTSIKDTAVFYYTSILEGGETSAKLIDSVELDSAITQDMYKYFDYDLNVALKSAQIVYAEDNETILPTATTTELNKTAKLSNPKDIDTAITWS